MQEQPQGVLPLLNSVSCVVRIVLPATATLLITSLQNPRLPNLKITHALSK